MDATTSNEGATNRSDPASTPTAQFLYEAFYGGAIGGSSIALFFLVLDSIQGQPLLTPSLIGTALLGGAEPSAAAEVRLDMVAYFTVIHFAAFLVLGAVVSKLCHWTGLSRRSPLGVLALVFVLLTSSFFGAGALVAGGFGAVLGVPAVLAANLVTAGAMAAFFARAHREA